MFCSNNYLSLSNHPHMKELAKTVDTHGVGSGSVRPIAGTMDLHLELEERLARFRRPASWSIRPGSPFGLIPQLAEG